MSRSTRLLDLLQLLRRHRRPVTAATLAADTGVSVRSVYRDIATLIGQGAPITGEAGIGYALQPGYVLPPLSFRDDEIDALMLGLALVTREGDPALAVAAENARGKIAAVLTGPARLAAEEAPLVAGPRPTARVPGLLGTVRRALREEHKLRLLYVDGSGAVSERLVWPVALAFFESVRVLAAWCENRRDFRHFRLDRIERCEATEEHFPRRRGVLLAEWRAQLDVAPTPPDKN